MDRVTPSWCRATRPSSDNKEWKALIEEEKRDALVRFVKAHIIVGLQSPKSLEGVYENLNGRHGRDRTQ